MSTVEEDTRGPRMAWSLYKRVALAALLIVLLTAGASATVAYIEIDDDITRVTPGRNRITIPGLEGVKAGQPQTLLVLGSDSRYIGNAKQEGRSDTMILIRLDPDKKATAIMNIPRDLLVDIPGHKRDKINVAYTEGGPQLALKTVQNLLAKATPDGSFPINHIVNVNFNGFQRAINRLGCIYADIDHHYFNDNSGPGPDYSVIDIPAGYQRLCGGDALSYVRYRHLDNDLVRAARQQQFLSQAKDQIGTNKLIKSRKDLFDIVGNYTQTDIHGRGPTLTLIKLAIESAANPVQQVQFQAEEDGDYLKISDTHLKRDVGLFLGGMASKGGRGKVSKTAGDRARERSQRRRARRQKTARGLIKSAPSESLGIQIGAKLPFRVYYPGQAAVGSTYDLTQTRAYNLYSPGGHKHAAYRYVVSAPGLGQFYGVQGTNWTKAPLLDDPHETRTVRGRKLQLYFDGDRLRMVAWLNGGAAYWVSNTLLQSLSNRQMLGIASSLRRVGS